MLISDVHTGVFVESPRITVERALKGHSGVMVNEVED
jgi:hypothetical protein